MNSEQNKIPGIIHFCWFGRKEYDDRTKKCIESWSRVCPDYVIKRWDEDSFDFSGCIYAKQAYQKGRYCFVADYARFKVLKEFGGFYFDTDVELLKPLEEFRGDSAVFSFKQKIEGMKQYGITSGIMGSMKNTALFDSIIKQCETKAYLNERGEEDFTPIAKYLADMLNERGFAPDNTLQRNEGICLLPNEYLCPTIAVNGSGNIAITENTHAIHYFTGSWRTPEITELLINRIKNAKAGETVV